jgi:elongin-A
MCGLCVCTHLSSCFLAVTTASLAIATLGDDLSYPLVKPILERCTAEQLLEIEGSSPVRAK